MPARTGARGTAAAMPATVRSRQRPQLVDTAAEEAARFGTSHLTRVMREDLRRVKVPPPELLDPSDLAEAVRERDEYERRRHDEATRRAQREYEEYLAGREGRALPQDDYDEPVVVTDEGDVEPARNPVRERLEHEAAATRGNKPVRGRRSDALAQLEREADAAAADLRTSAARQPLRPTHERLVKQPSRAIDRESQLLTDAPLAPVDTNVQARLCVAADVDRLWDWIRADQPSGLRFVGRPIANSQQLYTLMQTIAKGEDTRTSLARSIYVDDEHVGFVVLLPILITVNMAAVHMYLRPESRGLLPAMLPSLLQLAADVMPDVKLAVMGMPPALDKLLHPYGFRMQTVFLQE